MMGGFGGVIVIRGKFDEMSDRGWRVGLLRCLGSGPQSTMGGETMEYVGSFWTLLIALESAECFESVGQVVAGGCCASLQSGGMGGHSVVCGEDFDKWEFEYTIKTRSTLELSPEHPEISVRWDLASVTWRGVLCPCQVLSWILEHGDNSGVRFKCRTATKSSSVQRRVRDSSRGSEGSGILVDIQTEENTWLMLQFSSFLMCSSLSL